MAFEWTVPPTDAFGNLYTDYEKKIYYAINTLFRRRAPEIQNWMRMNRRWIDRTGNARASLAAEVVSEPERITMLLTFGRLPHAKKKKKSNEQKEVLAGTYLEYAKFLEFGHAGKYAIIGPALDYWKPVLSEDIKRLLR